VASVRGGGWSSGWITGDAVLMTLSAAGVGAIFVGFAVKLATASLN
jgi:hypothetical protein